MPARLLRRRVSTKPDHGWLWVRAAEPRPSRDHPTPHPLPRVPFRQPHCPADQPAATLSLLPLPEPGVRLVSAVQAAGLSQSIATIEFTPLGGTTSPAPTTIWLACGSGSA